MNTIKSDVFEEVFNHVMRVYMNNLSNIKNNFTKLN